MLKKHFWKLVTDIKNEKWRHNSFFEAFFSGSVFRWKSPVNTPSKRFVLNESSQTKNIKAEVFPQQLLRRDWIPEENRSGLIERNSSPAVWIVQYNLNESTYTLLVAPLFTSLIYTLSTHPAPLAFKSLKKNQKLRNKNCKLH